jgi:DNA modification methylase
MTIIHGDCLQIMRNMESNSISAIVTDPPYGLKFMGKDWDKGIPGVSFWSEMLRICKPGSFLLAFGGTRTFHRLTCSIEDAGWEIRDCIMWLYAQGFPKGKGCLKPAWEPIIMARKKGPHPELNIDDCRIRTIEKLSIGSGKVGYADGYSTYDPLPQNELGRWPANLILDEETAKLLDEQTGDLKTGGGDKGNKTQDGGYGKGYGYIPKPSIANSGGASRFFFIARKDKSVRTEQRSTPEDEKDMLNPGNRFFYCAKASSSERNKGCENLQAKYANKIGHFNNPGNNGSVKNSLPMANHHPTVKPIKLMEYLIKLIMPPKDGILLDPFSGSGSTLIAAKNLGYKSIGIEMHEEYCEIAMARLK